MAKHRVLVGINYPDGKGGEKRAEEGDVVDDLPAGAVKGLLDTGMIEVASASPKKKSEPKADVAPEPSAPESGEEG